MKAVLCIAGLEYDCDIDIDTLTSEDGTHMRRSFTATWTSFKESGAMDYWKVMDGDRLVFYHDALWTFKTHIHFCAHDQLTISYDLESKLATTDIINLGE